MNLIQYLCTGEVLLTLFFLGKKSPWEAQIFSKCPNACQKGTCSTAADLGSVLVSIVV